MLLPNDIWQSSADGTLKAAVETDHAALLNNCQPGASP